MKRIPFFIPYLIILALATSVTGCSIFSSEDKGQVIERRTETTIERPVVHERKTTTTTTIRSE